MLRSTPRWLRAVALGLALAACTGKNDSVAPPPPEVSGPNNPVVPVPQALIDATWVVRIAVDADRAPFEQQAWVDHVIKRDYATSVPAFAAAGGGLPLGRAHADAAGMYRSAAKLAAESLIQTYDKTPDSHDPVAASHLEGIAHALLGQTDDAKKHFGKFTEPGELAAWHAPWKAWVEAGAKGGPDLSGLPIGLGEPTPGTWPPDLTLPSYSLPEINGSTFVIPMGDPGALLALAEWHEAAARKAAGAEAQLVDVYGARLRLPIEDAVRGTDELPLPLLFGSDLLHPSDGAFLAALKADGPGAVDAWAKRSLIAALAQAARVDGKVSAEKANDLVEGLRGVIVQEMEEKAGSQQGFHRLFADVAIVGAYRGIAEVAAAEGEPRTYGLLRQYAYDKDSDAAADPGAVLAYAAWVAGNRNPQRPADMLNPFIGRYPSLHAARLALDTLGVRVSREQPGVGPSQ